MPWGREQSYNLRKWIEGVGSGDNTGRERTRLGVTNKGTDDARIVNSFKTEKAGRGGAVLVYLHANIFTIILVCNAIS